MPDVDVLSESNVVVVPQDDMVPTRVVSEITMISTRSIFRRIEKGLFPAGVREGRLWKWKRTDIEKWIAENPQGKPAPATTQPAPAKPKPAPAKTKKVKKQAVVAEVVTDAVPEAILHPIPAAVIAAVENVAPVGADLIAAEVGGVA